MAPLLACLLLAGCAADPGAESPQIEGTVMVRSGGEILVDTEVSVDEGAMADQAIIKACQAENLAYTYMNGLFDHFDGVASDAVMGWLVFVNDELPMEGASDIELMDGFTLIVDYVSYAEYFGK